MSEVTVCVAGADEVGLGSAAHAVYSAAVILDPERPVKGLADSKKLTPKRRRELSEEIREKALAWCVATASVEEIEALNVRRAALLAMRRAVEGLCVTPDLVFVDGNLLPDLDVPAHAVVRGDDVIDCISAASIIAKVARDEAMQECHRQYPQYGFDSHKGYLTATHRAALREHGPCPLHRKSYAPIRELLAGRNDGAGGDGSDRDRGELGAEEFGGEDTSGVEGNEGARVELGEESR
jgi:ribonuclease HII